MARQYRKKPVVISAERWISHDLTPMDDVGDYLMYFNRTSIAYEKCEHCKNPRYEHGWIKTFEGGHIVCPGDWIITGIKGEKYPCKPDIFSETYELVE